MSDATLPRMRDLKGFFKQYKIDDPDGPFTPHSIRALGIQKKIPCCMVGNRRFYNYDAFLEILATNPDSLSVNSVETTLTTPMLSVRSMPGRMAK